MHGKRVSLVAIALFAVTIGVTTAIYAVVEAVILRPINMRAPKRTAVIWQRDDPRGTPVVEAAHGEVDHWRRNARSVEALGVFSSVNWSLSLVDGDSRARLAYAAVSAPFFEVVGVMPQGSTFPVVRRSGFQQRRVSVGSRNGPATTPELTDALWTTSGATIVGLLGALGVGRALAGFVVGTSAYDPLSLAGAAAVTLCAGGIGCVLAAQGGGQDHASGRPSKLNRIPYASGSLTRHKAHRTSPESPGLNPRA